MHAGQLETARLYPPEQAGFVAAIRRGRESSPRTAAPHFEQALALHDSSPRTFNGADLAPSSKTRYLVHADRLVRWLAREVEISLCCAHRIWADPRLRHQAPRIVARTSPSMTVAAALPEWPHPRQFRDRILLWLT